jgi:hypothetical protein
VNKVNKFAVTVKEKEIDIHDLGKVMEAEQLAYLLENMLNGYDNPVTKGNKVGEALQNCHRTLQGCVINFCLGVLIGIISQYGDPRNEVGLQTCCKIKELLEKGELRYQPFI